MKKLILFILLLALPCHAQDGYLVDNFGTHTPLMARMNVGVLGGGVSAAACSTPSGDLSSEGFEGGAEETWTNIQGTPDFAYALSGLSGGTGAAQNCSYGMKINAVNTYVYALRDLGAGQANLYIKFSFYVDSHSIAEGTNTTILKVGSASNESDILLYSRLKLTGGNLQFGPTAETYYNISINTWYYVELYVADASESCTYKIGTTYGGSDIASEPDPCPNVISNPRYIFLGNTATSRTIDIIYGYFAADDDGTF